MARKFIKLPSLSNVAASSTATLQCPVGVTYHKIDFQCEGVTPSQMENIRVEINGKPIQEYKNGTRLNDINAYYSRHVESGIVTLWFDSPHFDNVPLRRTTGLGTLDVSTLQVKFGIASGVTNPKIEAYATVSPATPLGMIRKVKTYVVSNAATGIKEVADLPREGRIPAMFLFKDDIADCEVQINSVAVYEPNKALGEKIQRDYGRVPNGAKYTAIDFNLEGDPNQGLSLAGVADFRIRPNFTTAGAADVVVEYLSTFGGI